jgi:predicted CXXCH cytochrome family protein
LFESSPHKAAFEAASLPGCVTCHSNHRIAHPTDAMLGTGPQSVCTNCHTDGDAGYLAAGQIAQEIAHLDTSVKSAAEILDRAEAAGMEVSEAQLEQDQARDALTKSRVTIHSFNSTRVKQDTAAGLQITAKTRTAGVAALGERDYRRKGLAWSLLAIVAVVVGLRLYVRQLERRPS